MGTFLEKIIEQADDPITIFLWIVVVIGGLYFKELLSIIQKRNGLRKEILEGRLERASRDNSELKKDLQKLRKDIDIYRKNLISCRKEIEGLRDKDMVLISDLKNVENLVRIMRNSEPGQADKYSDEILEILGKIIESISTS